MIGDDCLFVHSFVHSFIRYLVRGEAVTTTITGLIIGRQYITRNNEDYSIY